MDRGCKYLPHSILCYCLNIKYVKSALSPEMKLYSAFRRYSEYIQNMRTVWKVRGLGALLRSYAEGGGDCYAKL
jgi:hypothetical protein